MYTFNKKYLKYYGRNQYQSESYYNLQIKYMPSISSPLFLIETINYVFINENIKKTKNRHLL